MKISYDPKKRARTLTERGLDFESFAEVFDAVNLTYEDKRHDYGETRLITIGFMGGRMVVVVWTQRGAVNHIISMRRANEKEQKRYKIRLD